MNITRADSTIWSTLKLMLNKIRKSQNNIDSMNPNRAF